MEEQFILRVLTSSVMASSSMDEWSLNSHVSEDGRSDTFVIGNDCFPASLLDLPRIVESYKTYVDSALFKTADFGQKKERRSEDEVKEAALCVDIPALVQPVEKDLLSIMADGTAENVEDGDENDRNTTKKASPAPAPKLIPDAGGNPAAAERSDSDESDDLIEPRKLLPYVTWSADCSGACNGNVAR